MIFETLGVFLSKVMCFSAYVQDATHFPRALTKEEENVLVKKIKLGDENARNELIEHNLRLVSHIVKKYSTAGDADDFISAGTIGLIKGIDSYDDDKGSQLSTYCARCIENEILMYLRRTNKTISG